MTQDSFPDREPDGEEPDGSGPLPAGNEPEGGIPEDEPEGPEQGLFMCLPAEELTLAGFAQNGRADTMAPGALLATLLDAITGEGGSGLAGLADDQLIGIISAARRMESRAAWTLMAGLAELARRRPAVEPADSGQAGFSDFAPDEVAAELHLTNQSASDQMEYACTVADQLPRCFAALYAGQIHPVHLRIIQDEVAMLSPDDMARADEQLAEMAKSLTFGRLRSKAHQLVLKLDPDAARRRKEAAKQDAHVRRYREASGNAGMIAQELPPDEILASWQHIEQRALDLRAAGMPGTLRELRVLAFLDLLQERDSRLVPAGPDTDQAGRPAGSDRGGGPDRPQDRAGRPTGPGGGSGPGEPGGSSPGGSGPSRDGPGGSGGPGSGPPRGPAGTGPDGHPRRARQDGPSVAALVNITVPLATWLGQSDTPADVAGFGLLDAEDARDLLAAAARHPHTRWCVTAVHPDGTAAAHGCAHGRHPPPGPASGGRSRGPAPGPDPPPGPARPTATDTHSAGPGPGPPPGTAGTAGTAGPAPTCGPAPCPDPPPGLAPRDYLASLRIRIAPIARGHCDHARAEAGYRPSRALQHLVKVRNARCTAPGCGRPAARCDLDHTVAWEHGGLTCECDLAPLCRHHHRCKQSQGWKLEQPSPGVLRWRTPAGRSYITTPTTYQV
jgi:Domain of unknown function (DUF222)